MQSKEMCIDYQKEYLDSSIVEETLKDRLSNTLKRFKNWKK
jgi:hypothetical protein